MKHTTPTTHTCHYCDGTATTRDHIVPRSRALFLGANAVDNIVPACSTCNRTKADLRSDCACLTCILAWDKYGPPGWPTIPVVILVPSRALA